MDVLRLAIIVVLGLCFVVAAVGNASLIVCHLWRGTRGSMVPFIGGLAGTLALLLAGHGRWCWIALVLDAGTVLGVIGLAFVLCTRGRDTNRDR